eukprot:CAMPEP_0183359714 /NCGR_PEP_ID=MMETSP0164_2-20130417/53079_1 /TAXON_ID=221442 /ORGANISM="Coccolithus pelagicus ssp braarudi, Strain PLY182g" /LENGTH=124 /DNA_ID=CAMNT_0025533895 /DNA_START=57 /DNA_END=431 /DNA_ORIENTATION=-
MSGWDAHLQKLTAYGVAAQMHGLDGTKWAGAGVSDDAAQIKYLIGGFGNPGSLRAKGPTLGNTKYMITRAEGDFIIGKKGAAGFVAVKSKQAVTIAVFNEDKMTPNQANVATQAFKDYLIGLGF